MRLAPLALALALAGAFRPAPARAAATRALHKNGKSKAKSGKTSKFGKGKASKSGGATPAEEQLGLRFLTPEEAAEAFDESSNTAVTHWGLVNFASEGPGAKIAQLDGAPLPFQSYEEFQRWCLTECHHNDQCTAVMTLVDLSEGATYGCGLYDTNVEVRGVRAAQRADSPFATDLLFVKKGSTVQEHVPCKVDYPNVELSYACLACGGPASPDYCADLGCDGLLSAPDNEDFLPKMAPSAVCLGDRTGACLACTTGILDNIFYLGDVIEPICAAEEERNLVRGLCRAECYEGIPQCEGAITMAALCGFGSPLIRYEDGGYTNGGITAPYECPAI